MLLCKYRSAFAQFVYHVMSQYIETFTFRVDLIRAGGKLCILEERAVEVNSH
jgi:hypothetical protein